jgi:hypothetical protein
MSIFKKKKISNLKFTEIRAVIFNITNNTFERILIENVTDKVFIKEGKIFTILPEYVQPVKYDSETEVLHGIKKIKRMMATKRLGILYYIIDENNITANNKYEPKSKYEMVKEYVGYVKCNALLFKAWTESMDYKNAIRSLPTSKLNFNFKGKWIVIIGIIVVIVVVGLIFGHVVKIPGVVV